MNRESFFRPAVALVATAACFTCACEPDEPVFETWAGSWQAAEPLFLDPAADAAYQAIHELRPEYSVEEIEALFLATAEVGYTSLEVDATTLTFVDGDEVVCRGRYAAAGEPDPGSLTGPESYYDFALTESLEGDCDDYDTVSITGLLPEGPEVHFHVVTSSAAGRLQPPPWNPSVWSTTTTAAYFAERLETAAPAIAMTLPER